jgi:Protein of unknown function (DUF2867)
MVPAPAARSHQELAMSVIECDVPASSALDRELIGHCDFSDSYRAPLSHPGLGMAEIFFAVFGHTPFWMKAMLILRNALARLAGLEVPTVAEIMRPEARAAYKVGDKIGPWPVFFVGENEIIAGRDNKHMDFRLSVLKVMRGDAADVVVTTVCSVHNLFGTIYLSLIVPFHRSGVQALLSRAVKAGRL